MLINLRYYYSHYALFYFHFLILLKYTVKYLYLKVARTANQVRDIDTFEIIKHTHYVQGERERKNAVKFIIINITKCKHNIILVL